MREFGNSVLRVVALFAVVFCSGAVALHAEESPPWAFKPVEGEVVTVENPEWHAKDVGWLFTCRLRVKSTNLVKPIAHLQFEGFATKEAEEPIWTQRKVIRRKDFDAAYGGGDSQFVRVFVTDAPPEVAHMTLHFDNGDKDKAEE